MALAICSCTKDEIPFVGDNENVPEVTTAESSLIATLENNEATRSLLELLKQGEIIISMNDYGGFEKVGSLPQSLPRNDTQITTTAGDIMLYQGNQIVIFYGSNTWAYTRLGRIDGLSAAEIQKALGSGTVSVTLSQHSDAQKVNITVK